MAAFVQVTPAGASRPLQVQLSKTALNNCIRQIRGIQSTRSVSASAGARQRLNSRAARPVEGVTEDGVEGQLVEEADIDTVNLDESVGADTPAPEAKVAPKEDPSKVQPAVYALSFLWLEKNIAVAVDQVFNKDTRAPLSEFFFWPRKDAWEELKACLESKPWISERDKVLLLNKTTEVINFWQTEGTKHSVAEAQEKFPDCFFMGA